VFCVPCSTFKEFEGFERFEEFDLIGGMGLEQKTGKPNKY